MALEHTFELNTAGSDTAQKQRNECSLNFDSLTKDFE